MGKHVQRSAGPKANPFKTKPTKAGRKSRKDGQKKGGKNK